MHFFCKITNGEIPCKKVYEDESVIAFHDLDPQAPTHVLIIPKMHISSAMEINEENSGIIGHIYEVAAKISSELGLENGFRIVNNCGEYWRTNGSSYSFPFTWRSFYEMASRLIICFNVKHLERKRSHHYGDLSYSNW